MESLATSESVRIWAATAAFLFLKMLFNSFMQGYAAKRSRHYPFKEDAQLFGKGAAPTDAETDFHRRANTCWENDLENIPIFLFLFLGYALLGGDAACCFWYSVVFCGSRLGQAIFMMIGKQPHRTLAFLPGTVVCFCLIVGIARRAWGF